MKIIRVSAIWCSSCIITHKIWEELKEKYPSYEYIEYDYDDDEDKVKEYNIGNILPVIIILKDDKEIKRIVGEKSKVEFLEQIESIGD